MSTFRTTDGRKWTLAVNVGTVKRVRELAGVNLLSLIADTSAVASVFSDDVKLAEVLAACVQPQFAQAKIAADDFYAAIDGTVIEQATEALLREIANFFQEPRRSILLKALEKVGEKNRASIAEGAAAALEALETMEIEIPDPSTLTNSASSLPASAA